MSAVQAGTPEAKAKMAAVRAARARPTRQEVRSTERRRRTNGTIDRMAQFTLDIFDESQLDPNYIYRWVEDSGARMRQATKADDYDPVCADEIPGFDPDTTDSEGSGVVRMVVGRRENGQPIYQHLLKKPREYFEADQAEGVRRRTEMLEGRILHGETGHAGDHDRGVENAYVAEGSQIGVPGPGRDVGVGRRKVGPVGQV